MSSTTASVSVPGTALVTGATAGIGLTFVHQLADRGHDLVLVARNAERLAALAQEVEQTYDVAVETLAADLTVREELATVEQRVADATQPVELLVNNAGFGLKERFLMNSVEDEQRLLDIHVTAPMRLSHAALGAMTQRGHGGIINVSSVAAFLPRGTYAAAKAWVNSFSEWASGEYRTEGVTVMALCPGFTKTEFHERMGVARQSAPGFLWLDADQLVADGLADFDKGKAMSVPSVQYKAVVGLSRAIPHSVLQRFQSLGRK